MQLEIDLLVREQGFVHKSLNSRSKSVIEISIKIIKILEDIHNFLKHADT